jgi:hypothetical protein
MNSFSNKELYYFVNSLQSSHTKCRDSTKPKRDKEKEKKLKNIAYKSKRKNRGNKR